MKLKIYIIVFIYFGFLGCSEDFLDLAPISNPDVRTFYQTNEDMYTALNGVYSSLTLGGVYGYRLIEVPEYRGGNTQTSWMTGDFNRESIIEFTEIAANPHVTSMWTDAYRTILNCNVLIDRTERSELDQADRSQIIGEARFIRALMHFNLVRLFGDVPIVTTEFTTIVDSYERGREPVNQVYEQIISDLTYAEENLPLNYSSADVGRVTKGAAKALLGKVYLTQHEFSEAKAKLEEVIDMGIYDLLPDYGYLWDLNYQNSEESIFAVQHKSGGTGTGSPLANAFAPKFSAPHTVTVGSASGNNSPNQDIEDAYEPGDLRKELSMVPGYYGDGGEWVPDKWCIKYHEDVSLPNDGDKNHMVIRYADVILMYAEVLNEIGYIADGDAFMYLNKIRDRAGLQPKTSSNSDPDLAVSDQESFRKAIYHERRVELAFEGHRWFDLVRWGIFLETMSDFYFSDFVKDHHTLFAVPQSQVDMNPDKIWQNPGYVL